MRLPRYRFGEFELDPPSRELLRNGQRVALPPKSFECLAYLVANRERAVGRDELIAAVWGRVEVNDTVVAQTLLRARKALDDSGELQTMIRTVPRFGYRWVGAVEEIHEPHAAGQPLNGAPADEAPPVLATSSSDAVQAPTPAITPNTGRTHPARWPWLLVLLAIVVAAAVAWWWQARPGASPVAVVDDLVVVLPVKVVPANGENAWVRLGAMEYIASRLRRAGLKVLPSDQTLHLSTRYGDTSAFTEDDWRRLQQDTGARWILQPEGEHAQAGWSLRLQTREGGSVHAVKADAATPLVAAAQATDSWLRRLRPGSHAEERLPSPLVERVQQIDAELLAGQLGAARHLIERAPTEQRHDPRLRVREGQLEYRAGQMSAAADIFRQLLAMQPAVAPDIRARALMGQGAIAIRNGDFVSAEARYTAALQVLEQDSGQEAPAMLGNAYNGRGVARVNQRKMTEAVRDMGMARIAMQRSGDFVEAAMVGSNLGSIEALRGHFPQALQEFDHAIAVFERFDVHDYLAASLMTKANVQLESVQPAEAATTIARTDALLDRLEDRYLANRIRVVKAHVQLANGRLADAASGIAQLQAADTGVDASDVQQLNLQLLSARGDTVAAGKLARELPAADERVPAGLPLAAAQAALRAGDIDTARVWHRRSVADQDSVAVRSQVDPAIIAVLLAQASGASADALRQARAVAVQVDGLGNPQLRVQTGLLQIGLLMDESSPDGAAALLGDLDSFATRDYRVAWAALALYRSLGEPGMVDVAQRRLESLRGEREISVAPLL